MSVNFELCLGTAPESSGRDGTADSNPAEMLRVARKVVWYDEPEQTLADLKTFLSHLMVYDARQSIFAWRICSSVFVTKGPGATTGLAKRAARKEQNAQGRSAASDVHF